MWFTVGIMSQCAICQSSASITACEVCAQVICKKCSEHLPPDAFSHYSKPGAELLHSTYCLHCFDKIILPARATYETVMQAAENVYYLSKQFRGNVYILKRHTKRVAVGPVADRRECILRLAFVAAELKLNAIIEADIVATKVRSGAYQTTSWSGSALPANIDGERLEKSSLKGF